MSDLLLKPRPLPSASSGVVLDIDPRRARWELLSFEVVRLKAGERHQARREGHEAVVVVLAGRASVRVGEARFSPVGERPDVFSGRAHAVYVPLGEAIELEALAAMEAAIAFAPARLRLPPRWIKPEAIEVEARGDGNASRTIHHVLPPESPADRLMVVEVFTPSGNWSSYPPHKHDEHNPPHEHDLEEIYYYRIDRPEGFAIQRVYTGDGRVDETLTVRDGELVLVREGYHPVVAAPGCSVYYLNVLAGSGRSMAATDDPALAWVRGTWKRPQRPIT